MSANRLNFPINTLTFRPKRKNLPCFKLTRKTMQKEHQEQHPLAWNIMDSLSFSTRRRWSCHILVCSVLATPGGRAGSRFVVIFMQCGATTRSSETTPHTAPLKGELPLSSIHELLHCTVYRAALQRLETPSLFPVCVTDIDPRARVCVYMLRSALFIFISLSHSLPCHTHTHTRRMILIGACP